MSDHPSRELLTGFLLGRLAKTERQRVFFHLLHGCQHCRNEMSPLVRVMFRPGQVEPPPDDDPDYDGAIGRAFTKVLGWKEERDRERDDSDLKLALLLVGAPPLDDDFWTWGLCEVLLEKSWSLRHEDPRGMLRLAGLAVEAADRLQPERYGMRSTFDLRTRAWGEYANACRITDDLVQADRAISRALELHKQGSGSDLLRARLAELAAGIFSHQRNFDAALKAIDLAFTTYRKHGNTEATLRALVKRGIYTGRSGDPEQGLHLLAHALRETAEGSTLRFQVLHNILLFRVELGDFRGANLLLFEMRPLYAVHAGTVDLSKLRGIEGMIAAGLRDWERAERAFQQARQEFQARGQFYHAATLGLDLAEIWLRQGRTREMKALILETLDVFRSRYVARESIAALLMLRDALDRDVATIELLAMVKMVLEQHAPKAAGPA